MDALIDTVDFLWLASGDEKLSTERRDFIADSNNHIFLSAISVMEIAVKHSLGKLSLPADPASYIPGLRARHRISALPLFEAVSFALATLPPIHKDRSTGSSFARRSLTVCFSSAPTREFINILSRICNSATSLRNACEQSSPHAVRSYLSPSTPADVLPIY